ncbi:MAG: hypothetical protein A2X09_17430 [Bacteroidetes bacterium GWF2_43_11]|nr:MAG: hypothetical protein A2X09_17430 [Bacteroidetes bacterium GWF2_43_11]OGI11303.1 MAG: hypothetical protein A2X41_04245 [Candidatus Margulisbacteria bacterium GWE2_39_32]
MGKRGKHYNDEFKAKVVLELLKEEQTLNEVASKYGVHPKSLGDWKQQFMENAALAFNPEKVVSKYKEELKERDRKEDHLYKQIGILTADLDWAKKKVKELGLE